MTGEPLGFSLVAESRGYSLVVVHRLLTVMALLVEPGLSSAQAAGVAAHGLGSCGSQALEHRLNSWGTQA